MSNGVMLILRGIQNLLHEAPAIEYAKQMGYTPEVLDASGETGMYSAQTNLALKRIRDGNGDITALYGFSGGGYNALHIWDRLEEDEKKQIKKIVVIGSPGVKYASFAGIEDIIIYNNPDVAHMNQTDDFLKNMV